MVHLSPAMRAVEPYPFEELDRRKKEAVEAGRRVIDFGVGDPREETPALVRDALAEAIGPVSSYPRAAGLPALRRAIQAWVARRYGATLDPDTEILPTLGSKEIVFSLAQALVDPAAGKDLVITTAPGYPIAERGARFAGAAVERLRLTEERAFLPDLDALGDEQWDRACLLWLNYPNNPTGAVAPLGFLEEAAERCRTHDVLLASDEAYGELWFGTGPPPGALQLGDLHERAGRAHPEQAIGDDRLPKRVRRRRPIADRRAAPPAPGRRRHAAGVRPASEHRGLGRRAPRRGDAGALRGQARDLPRSVRTPRRACGRQRGDLLPVGGGARRPAEPRLGARPARPRRRRRGAGLVLRPGGGGVRADGDGADPRGVPARRRGIDAVLTSEVRA